MNSTFVNVITNYDGNQKNFIKEFASAYGKDVFSPKEMVALKGLFNATDSYRSQYNQFIIENLIRDGGIDIKKIEDFSKLGGWMG